MKISTLSGALLLALALAACTTPTAPPPEVIVVTATPAPGAPTAEPPDAGPGSFLAIIEPDNGTIIASGDEVQVTGSGSGMPNDQVLIFLVDAGLAVYGQGTATLGPPNDEGIQAYAGTLTASVASQTDGKIVSVVLNEDGSVAGSAGVFVTVVPDSFLTIAEPGEGATLSNPASFVVSGNGQGLPEDNVVVQALDDSGNLLAEQVTVLNSGQVGGFGEWFATLSVDVAVGTVGSILALSTNPADGSTVASAGVTVTYGE